MPYIVTLRRKTNAAKKSVPFSTFLPDFFRLCCLCKLSNQQKQMSGETDCTAFPQGDNLFEWAATINGSKDTVVSTTPVLLYPFAFLMVLMRTYLLPCLISNLHLVRSTTDCNSVSQFNSHPNILIPRPQSDSSPPAFILTLMNMETFVLIF